jgi:guanine nucleotide-binding protein subunit alpha
LYRLEESLDVFKDIVNFDLFKDTPWILFLNKVDMFEKKIQTTNIADTFPEYTGGKDFDKAIEFFKKMYLDLVRNVPVADIKVHVTCALDTTQVEKVLSVVRDFVASESLRRQGLGGF